MLYNYYTKELLELQGLNVKNIKNNDKGIVIYAEMERKEHTEFDDELG